MTLQQLKYLIQVAECSSLGGAAALLNISQPSLSVAIRNLERELGCALFTRGQGGMALTPDGCEVLGYARQIIQQVDALEHICRSDEHSQLRLSVSTQHYTFIADAFIRFAFEFRDSAYSFTFRETTTTDILNDVQYSYSEVGIIFCSSYNKRILERLLADKELEYEDIICLKPHVFLGRFHPLAKKQLLTMDEVESWPMVTYDRGRGAPSFLAEEVLCNRPCTQHMVVTDRDTAKKALQELNAYTIGTGIISADMQNEIVSIPLLTEEYIRVVYVKRMGAPLSPLATRFMEHVRNILDKLTGSIQ